jgi:hypothetical protein
MSTAPTLLTQEKTTPCDHSMWFDCLVPCGEICARVRALPDSLNMRKRVSITIVERLSARTALLSWSDAQFGCIAEQTWLCGRAQREDVCALSGERIKRGDPVYRPRKTTPPAINAGCVIAAHCVLDAVPVD